MGGGIMDWLPDPNVAMKFFIFFALGFENSRYVQAIREGRAEINTNVGTGETGRKFIGFTSYLHLCLMFLFFALHWFDYGFTKTIILFCATMFIIAPLISGLLLARLEYYFKEALWGYSSILVYPAAIWLAFSFSWFGAF
jgi:hypothetical protein